MEGMAVPSVRKTQLHILKASLDRGTRQLLALEKEDIPALEFWQFWATLEDLYGCDYASAYRERWHQVKLHTKSRKIALWEWRRYRVAHESAKLKVPDWTEEEERNLVLNQLPSNLLEEVLRQEHHQMGGDHSSLRIRRSHGLDEATLVATLASIWGLDTTILSDLVQVKASLKSDGYGWVVRCDTEMRKRQILALDGLTGKGITYHVCKFENRLTGTAIFDLG